MHAHARGRAILSCSVLTCGMEHGSTLPAVIFSQRVLPSLDSHDQPTDQPASEMSWTSEVRERGEKTRRRMASPGHDTAGGRGPEPGQGCREDSEPTASRRKRYRCAPGRSRMAEAQLRQEAEHMLAGSRVGHGRRRGWGEACHDAAQHCHKVSARLVL